MQYPIIDLITSAYINNGWTGLDIPQTITYEPIQLGSGTPSPNNIRPILPATTLNIGGVEVPVYGGSLDVSTGVLTVNRALWTKNTQTMNNNESYPGWQTSGILTLIGGEINETLTNQMLNIGTVFSVNTTSIYDILFLPTSIYGLSQTEWINLALDVQIAVMLTTPTTYQLTQTELENIIGSKDDIAHRLKLPLPHYFPHPVIDALQRAAAGTQTADDTEILRHYLTPLGIGGI